MGAAQHAILRLLAERAAGATICPSEAARRLAGPQGDWRAAMAQVHAAVDVLLERGLIVLSWKGTAMAARRGPYRIGAGSPPEPGRGAGGAPPAPGPARPRGLS